MPETILAKYGVNEEFSEMFTELTGEAGLIQEIRVLFKEVCNPVSGSIETQDKQKEAGVIVIAGGSAGKIITVTLSFLIWSYHITASLSIRCLNT